MYDYHETHSPQTSWSLRSDDINLCDITLLSHHQPIRNHTGADHIPYPVTISLTLPLNTLPCTPLACAGLLSMSHHIPCDYLPHIAFKNPSPKSIGECWSFEHEPSISPPWPHVRHLAINTVIFFHHNSVSVDWLH